MAPFLYALTLPNINQFLKIFHCRHQEKICNNIIIKNPTTSQACREMSSILKEATKKQDDVRS